GRHPAPSPRARARPRRAPGAGRGAARRGCRGPRDGEPNARRLGDGRGRATPRGVAGRPPSPRLPRAPGRLAPPPVVRPVVARRGPIGRGAGREGGAAMTAPVHPSRRAVLAIVQRALEEDVAWGDVTTDNAVPAEQRSRAVLLAKQAGVLCGGRVFAETFTLLDPGVTVELLLPDGAHLRPGDVVARIEGPTRALLTAERTALNFVQRLS